MDETISEANDGAEKVNGVMTSGDEGTTVFEKLTDAFKTAVQGIIQFESAERGGKVMKRVLLNSSCVILSVLIVGILIWSRNNKISVFREAYNDGVEQIDLDTIYLGNSGVKVHFSEILLEYRKRLGSLLSVRRRQRYRPNFRTD